MSIPVKILVVDDQPENVSALRAILERPDYELVTASSGADALCATLRHEFAVILLDVTMPEVASRLRRREATRTTPILFLSATDTDVSDKVALFVELYRQNRQMAELQVRNERRYRNLAEAIPQVVWVASADGTVEYMNGKWRELTGVSEYHGWRWLERVDEPELCRQRWEGAMRARKSFTVECRLIAADGVSRWHLCRGAPEWHRGQLVDWIGTFTDIHQQKLDETRAQTEVHKRDEFLRIASHELNTPLTSLQLQLQRVERALTKGATASVKEGIEVANRSARRLTNLVQLLLDTSRITAGRLRLERDRVELSALVRDVTTRLADDASRGGSPIEVTTDGELWGQWDRSRIDQVLSNLVTNALKYGDRKPVEVITRADGDEAVVVVRDRGIGIRAEDQRRIFERFTRAVSERNFGGLGLGLYIVGQIVAAHGGRVSVSSRLGEGTTFMVTLPR